MTTAFQASAFQGYAFQVDPVTGSIYVVDQNDNATLMGTVTGGGEFDTHDGFKDRNHYKSLQKKIAKMEAERDRLYREANERRQLDLRKIIAPETIAKVKQIEVESEEEAVSIEPETENVEKELNRLLLQQQYLLRKMVQKQAQAQFDAYMSMLKAKYEQNLKDEEALLLLL